MRISKRTLKNIIREECGTVVDMPATLDVEGELGIMETVEPSPVEVLAEMATASEALDIVLESMGMAAQLCPNCGPEVAAQAPVVEAMVAQAEALQEMLEAQADVLAESAGVGTDLDFTGDVGELPGDEAFAIGLQAGNEGLA